MTAVGQVAEQLRSSILDGRRAAGERLPSEPDLARELGVSRSTLRDALRALEDEGLVQSEWHADLPGPAKRTYELTDAGGAALERWVTALTETRTRIDSFLQRYEGRG